jgi:hypothetical protein
MKLKRGSDRKDAFNLGAHFIAFALINLHHVIHS